MTKIKKNETYQKVTYVRTFWWWRPLAPDGWTENSYKWYASSRKKKTNKWNEKNATGLHRGTRRRAIWAGYMCWQIVKLKKGDDRLCCRKKEIASKRAREVYKLRHIFVIISLSSNFSWLGHYVSPSSIVSFTPSIEKFCYSCATT